MCSDCYSSIRPMHWWFSNVVSPPNESSNESSWTMRPVDDASLRLCVPWMMRSLDDASLGRWAPWTMCPLDDGSPGHHASITDVSRLSFVAHKRFNSNNIIYSCSKKKQATVQIPTKSFGWHIKCRLSEHMCGFLLWFSAVFYHSWWMGVFTIRYGTYNKQEQCS